MRLETLIMHSWRRQFCRFGDAPGGHDQTTMEEYMEVVDLQKVDWSHPRCWDCIHQEVNLQRWECNMVRLLLGSYGELAVGGWSVARHTGSWSYIHWSNHSHENEGKTDNLGWILYMVFDLLTVCCTEWKMFLVYAVLEVCYTQCQLVIIIWRDQEGWPSLLFCNDGRGVEETDRWVWIMGMTCRIWADMTIQGHNILHRVEKTSYRCSYPPDQESHLQYWHGQFTLTQISRMSQFVTMISPSLSYLSLSCAQLCHHLWTHC